MSDGQRESATQTDEVTVTVDQDRCIGSGSCEMLEEAVFLLDDDTNIAGVVGDGQLPRARALIVIDRCPAAAISITSDETPRAQP